MREIKFRAWDKNKRVMINSKEIVRFFYDNEKLSASNGDTVHNELMQFTGLHDKNGKEIYEGDIVTVHTGDMYTVEWNDKGWWIKGINNRDHYSGWVDTMYEVIGNIYENLELLEGEKK